MTDYNFKINKAAISEGGAVCEATAEECRVLLALISLEGGADKAQLSKISGVSQPRIASAVAFWQEYGVLLSSDEVLISREFSPRVHEGEILEESALLVAKTIRDNDLSSVIEEFARLMGKPVASPLEVKRISALVTQYGLTAEYIALYMSHLYERGVLTSAARLASGAIKLAMDGIADTESLGVYIAENERNRQEYGEIKKLLGIYGRKLSASEERHFDKWCHSFGYGIVIIGEAYDITAINTGKASLPYMDKLLTDWHTAGAKTLEECRERYDSERAKRQMAGEKKAKEKTASTREKKPKPRYGGFDPEEALAAAIRRSSEGFSQDNQEDDGDK